MDDALVQNVVDNIRKDNTVLILVLMDDALVRSDKHCKVWVHFSS